MSKKFTVLALVLVFAAFAISVSAYNDDGSAFYCYNCSDCMAALDNNTFSVVYVNVTEMTNESGFCIDDPSNAENKIFDCNGAIINGSGVYISGEDNFTLMNCVIQNGSWGIHLVYSNFSSIINNTVYNTLNIFWLEHSSNNTVIFNNITHDSPYWAYGLNILYDSTNNNISSNIISNIGVAIGLSYGSSGNFVSSNTLSNFETGIWVYPDSPGNTIFNNTIYNRTLGTSYYGGIYLDNSSNNNVTGNNISNIDAKGGIYLIYNSNNNIIENNILSDFEMAYLGAIALDAGSDWNRRDGPSFNNISGNVIYNVSGDGIYLAENSSSNLLSNNLIYSNFEEGIDLPYFCMFNILFNNTIYDNEGSGIYLPEGSNSNNLSENKISNNGLGGIFVSSEGNWIANNSVYNNTYASIIPEYAYRTCNNTIVDNTGGCCGKEIKVYSDLEGVDLAGVDYAAIMFCGVNNSKMSNFEVHNNLSDGIVIARSRNITVTNLSIYSTGLGLFVALVNDSIFDNNKIFDAVSYFGGLFLIGLSNNISIKNNLVYNNNGTGFIVGESSKVTFSNNTITNNTEDGVYVASSSSVSFLNGTVNNNLYGFRLYESSVEINGAHIYNNTPDFYTESTSSVNLKFNGVIFDNPLGNYTNYMNVSMRDTGIGTYLMNWFPQPAPATKYSRFHNKSLVIDPTGSLTIDSITFHWTNAESAGFNESNLNVWDYGTSWRYASNQVRNTAGNNITITNLNRFSTFSILNGTYPIASPATGGKSSGGHTTTVMPPNSSNITEEVVEEPLVNPTVVSSGANKTNPAQPGMVPAPVNVTSGPEQKNLNLSWLPLAIILIVLFLIIFAANRKKSKHRI